MEIGFIDDDGNVLETVETASVEVSDDLGFSVDYLTEANEELPTGTAEIRIPVPDAT